jgi:hypothetical protein
VIIIKTNNGDVFVNEKTTHIVEHNREDKTVVIRNPQYKLNSTINDVEGIIYTNDAQPVSWKDEGSEIERLQKKLDEQRELGNKMRDEYLNIEQERDELKARLAELEPKEDPDRWWPDNVEVAPIEVIAGHIERSGYDPGYSVRLGKLFAANDIKKVGDLLRIGRRQFKKYRSVGGGSLSRIDNALEDLYDIKGW